MGLLHGVHAGAHQACIRQDIKLLVK